MRSPGRKRRKWPAMTVFLNTPLHSCTCTPTGILINYKIEAHQAYLVSPNSP